MFPFLLRRKQICASGQSFQKWILKMCNSTGVSVDLKPFQTFKDTSGLPGHKLNGPRLQQHDWSEHIWSQDSEVPPPRSPRFDLASHQSLDITLECDLWEDSNGGPSERCGAEAHRRMVLDPNWGRRRFSHHCLASLSKDVSKEISVLITNY